MWLCGYVAIKYIYIYLFCYCYYLLVYLYRIFDKDNRSGSNTVEASCTPPPSRFSFPPSTAADSLLVICRARRRVLYGSDCGLPVACFTNTTPPTLPTDGGLPPRIRFCFVFFCTKRSPVGDISSRLRALLLRRMASWKGRFSSRRSLLTTRGADTGDFKSPALALGRGAGTWAESSTNPN